MEMICVDVRECPYTLPFAIFIVLRLTGSPEIVFWLGQNWGKLREQTEVSLAALML